MTEPRPGAGKHGKRKTNRIPYPNKEASMRGIAKPILFCGLILLAATLCAPIAEACSVFRVTAKDGTILSGRTMEFGIDMKYGLVAVPRGREYASPAPEAKRGLACRHDASG